MAIQQTSHPDDSTWHGDPPLLLSDPSVVQVLFKNVNGLIKGDDSSGYDEWRHSFFFGLFEKAKGKTRKLARRENKNYTPKLSTFI